MILIISGTNRNNSNTLKLAKYYQKTFAEKGEEAEIIDLAQLPENFIASDMYGKRSVEFQMTQNQVMKATKFLFVVPEYNGSFPGVLKLFIDGCQFPDSFFDKKAALVGLSSGKYGNIRGVDHLTGICNYINLHVLPLKIHIPAIHAELNEEGHLFKDDTIKFVHEQIDRFIKF
jgi:NAD(P)H-dependent FMN reductase